MIESLRFEQSLWRAAKRSPARTHDFVVEAFESPETYEVEFDLETGQILATVKPEDIGLA